MKPLDDITARMFPTLARYARTVRRRELLALAGIVLSGYVLGRDLLSAYQGRVATEHMMGMLGRINSLEDTCQQTYPQRLTVTKAAAQVLTRQREDARTMSIKPDPHAVEGKITVDPSGGYVGGMRWRE